MISRFHPACVTSSSRRFVSAVTGGPVPLYWAPGGFSAGGSGTVLAPSSSAGGLSADDPPSLGGGDGKVPFTAGLVRGYYRTGRGGLSRGNAACCPRLPHLDTFDLLRYNTVNLSEATARGQGGAKESGGGLATFPKGEMAYVHYDNGTYWKICLAV